MQVEKTVFISYRRSNYYTALNVFQNLKARGFDVFFDFESIDSGAFEQTILNQIRARAHFLVILHADTLIRTKEPGDWVRREIETGIDEKRNVVPITFDDFDWKDADTSLTGKLGLLKEYNALDVPRGYFDEAMDRLESRYLNKPLDLVIQPTPPAERAEVERKIEAAAALPAPTDKEITAQELLSQAFTKASGGDHRGAIKDYDEAIRLNPSFAMAYNNRGWSHFNLGDLSDAMKDYNTALQLEPNNPLFLVNRSAARAAGRDFLGAIGDASLVVQYNPMLPGGYQALAWAYFQQGNWQAAIYNFTQAIMLYPSDPRDYMNRGWARFNLGDVTGAIEDYNASLYLLPNNAVVYNNRGMALQALGNLPGAVADFQAAIQLDPSLFYAYYNHGNVMLTWGQYDAALQDFERSISINAQYAYAYGGRGVARYYRGDSAGALNDLETAVKLDPNYAYARDWLMRIRSGIR